jgi:YesN/AraC family two-component response regulator
MNVLIVDDSATQRLILKSIANNYGSVKEVFEASDGTRALEVMKSNQIDLVFSDINMEPMSGFDLRKEILSMDYKCDFAFITSHLTDNVKNKASELGVDLYVTKPITQENIESILEKVSKV